MCMGLQERVYSVLIVSASEKFQSALRSLLPESAYSPIVNVSSVGAAERARNGQDFDFVFVKSPLPDDAGIRFAIDCCRAGERWCCSLRRRHCMTPYGAGWRDTGYSSCPGPFPGTLSSGG